MPTPSVTCLTGPPTPPGNLSRPFPATPVTPLTVPLTPLVAESVIVFSVPVVVPTVLFSVPVAVEMPLPTTPGCCFFARGVAIWPSGFALTAGVFLTAGALEVVGVDFTGVAFVAEETALVVLFTGVPGVFLTVLAGLEAAVVSAAGVFLIGKGLTVPRGVRAGVGLGVPFPVALTAGAVVFFTAGVVSAFLTAPGVAFAGVVVAFGVADAPLASSFLGTFFTGVVAEFAVFVAVAVAFLTGVALVAVAGFFAVDCATLERFPTLDCSEAFCCFS